MLSRVDGAYIVACEAWLSWRDLGCGHKLAHFRENEDAPPDGTCLEKTGRT